MLPEIYWLNQIKTGRLAIMPRPRGDDWLPDEIVGLRQLGVDILVSLLEYSEIISRSYALRGNAAETLRVGRWHRTPSVPNRHSHAERGNEKKTTKY